MGKFFKWLWHRDHTWLAGFVTLCMVIELLPAQSIAYATEGLAEATPQEEVVASEAEEAKAEAQAPAEEATPVEEAAPAEEPAAVVEESEGQGEAEQQPEEAVVEETDEQKSDSEEPAKAEDEKASKPEEKEITYPATTLKDSASGVMVTIEAREGALPEGAKLVLGASGLGEADVKDLVSGKVESVKAVDISFKDKDGEKIQPQKPVTVTLSGDELAEGQSLHVVHVIDGVATLVKDATVDGGSAKFASEKFSPFALVVTSPETEEAEAAEDETKAEEQATESETEAEEEAEAEKVPTAKRKLTALRAANDNVWTVTFYNRDAQVYKTVEVEKNSAIGTLPATIAREDYNAYWAVGEIVQGGQGSEIHVLGPRIDATYVPTDDTIIVPDYDMISYTVTFVDENGATVATKKVDYTTSYCLNDIPAVPAKDGHTAKWVYETTDGTADFSNNVTITADTTVRPEYTKNVFTVEFMNGDKTYQTDTYYSGDTLTLPKDPVVEGKTFDGWYNGETKINGGETVTSDLTIQAKYKDDYYVNFVILNDDETESERLSQYYRTGGETIDTMPQDPFVAGKVFDKWVDKATGAEVTAETVVNGNMTVVAQFRTVDIYNITAEYYYLNDRGEKVIFNTDLIQVEADDLPYEITAPASTQTDPDQVSPAGTIYYPETPTARIEKSDFTDGAYTVEFKYVPYTATYDYVYMLKDLTGDGYTEIDRTKDVHGVLNSYVTPTVKNFDYATLELAEGANITQATGQELQVKYTRKNFQLTYDTKGGSYVAGVTVPYGTEQAVTSTTPTRDGYTFGGWYLDEDCTQAAGSTVTVNRNTTLYAKWTGATVNYTVVYMFEKYNEAGTTSSFVYDNSTTQRGTVGSTVTATSAPAITRKGWEADTAQNANSTVVIAADGSSVLYVYYKLRTYTFTFTINGDSTNGRYRMTIDGTTYRADRNTKYSFTAKLGQDISSQWPINGGNATIWDNNNYYYFYYWNCQGTRYASKILRVTEALLPSNGTNVSVTGTWRDNNNNVQVNYYLQNADNDNYTLSTLYSQTSPSGNYSAKEISGYTYDHADNDTDYWGNVTAYNFYYKRNTFKIDYYYGSANLRTINNVKFDANITGNAYNWTPTAAQCDVDSDYTFVGWFDNEKCEGNPYTFDKMPSSNLKLYAKWSAPSYTVSFDTDGGSSVDSQTVEKYKTASAPSTNPTKAGYVFDGWYTTADGNDFFEWNTQIEADTTVYAHWTRATLSYTVHYVDEDGVSVAPDKEVSNPNFTIGQSVTEAAIAVTGYRPDKNSQTIELAAEDNEITFVYFTKPETTTYTVNYVIADGETGAGTAVATKKIESVSGDTASVIELAAAVDYDALYAAKPELKGVEFYPDEVEKTLVLTADEEQNVLTFYYSSYKNVKVTVNFVDMNGDPIPGITADTQVLKVGKTFTLARTPIAGWEFNKAVEGANYSGTEAPNSVKITQELAENGTLVYTLFYQKKVTITANSDSKQYDGTELKLPSDIDGQVTVDGLVGADALTSIAFSYVNADNTTKDGRINAGTATVTPKNASISGKGKNADYYTVRYIAGTLTVTKINVTVRIEPDRWVNAPYTGENYLVGFTNPQKTAANGADYVMISHEGYAELYQETIWDMVTSLNNVKRGGAGLGYYVESQKDVCDIPYNLELTSADMPTGGGNYSVSLYVRPGRLQIVPAEVTITAKSAERTYNGAALTQPGFDVEGLAEGDTHEFAVVMTDESTITNVGTADNVIATVDGVAVTAGTATEVGNYIVTTANGTLKVNKRKVTLTSATDSKTYDGDPLMNDEVTVGGDGFADGEGATYDVTGTITNVGTVENTFTYTLNEGTKADNYEITATPGTLTIAPVGTEVIVTIKENSGTYTYDGSEKNVKGYEVVSISNNLYKAKDFTFSGNDTVKGTDASTYQMELKPEDFTNTNDNFSKVKFVIQDGALEITKRPVTFTGETATETYTGSEIELTGVTAGGDGLVSGHTSNVTYSAKGKDVGEYPGTITAKDDVKIMSGSTDVTANYEITTMPGKLTIEQSDAEFAISLDDDEYTYDGQEHSNAKAATSTAALLQDGHHDRQADDQPAQGHLHGRDSREDLHRLRDRAYARHRGRRRRPGRGPRAQRHVLREGHRGRRVPRHDHRGRRREDHLRHDRRHPQLRDQRR